MRKIGAVLAVLALLAAGAAVYRHAQTGRWSLLPGAASPAEAELERLEAELAEVEGKIAVQERTAGLAGVEAPPALTDLWERRDALRARIAAARAALK
jgi:hypothetical protein